ncbi:MAG TPA: hypothetical protein VGW75_00245 [Solirubrobacteraceae bacterium]|jgi:uncharacterized membrane protein|nr:hypothetical protein [Solirubrobacteraceae bacterium]
MSVVLLIRPAEWEIPLFVHVLSAMVLVGAVLLAATSLAGAWRTGDAAAVRLGYRSLLLAALPAWVVMRASAQWLLAESPFDDDETWVGIGFMTSETSFLLLIAATVLAGLSVRRAQAGGRVRAAVVLVGIALALFLVAIYAMTAKPG